MTKMREIKFKILKIDLHSFLYDEGRTILEIGIEDLEAIRHNPKNYLFIQYTGLKDRNGKEIYEGGIVKHAEYESYRWEVFWQTDRWYLRRPNKILKWEYYDNGDYYNGALINDWKEWKIIGNIYKNPELLNKEE